MLSASILSADFAHLADQVKLVELYAEVIHIDVMDAHFVPPLTIGPVVVASLRPVTDRVFHGHLMVEAPESLFDDLAEAGLDIVSFHHEAVADPAPVIAKARGDRYARGDDAQHGDTGGRDLPVPGRAGRRDAHEHQTGLVGTGVEPRRVSAARGRAGARSIVAACPRTWSSTAGSRSTTHDARSMREPPCWSPRRRSSRRPIRRRPPASLRRSREERWQPRWPRPSSSSTTIRISRGSSR